MEREPAGGGGEPGALNGAAPLEEVGRGRAGHGDEADGGRGGRGLAGGPGEAGAAAESADRVDDVAAARDLEAGALRRAELEGADEEAVARGLGLLGAPADLAHELAVRAFVQEAEDVPFAEERADVAELALVLEEVEARAGDG